MLIFCVLKIFSVLICGKELWLIFWWCWYWSAMVAGQWWWGIIWYAWWWCWCWSVYWFLVNLFFCSFCCCWWCWFWIFLGLVVAMSVLHLWWWWGVCGDDGGGAYDAGLLKEKRTMVVDCDGNGGWISLYLQKAKILPFSQNPIFFQCLSLWILYLKRDRDTSLW